MLFADANYIYTTSESYLSFAFPKGSNALKKKINRIFAISLLFANSNDMAKIRLIFFFKAFDPFGKANDRYDSDVVYI